MKNIFNVTIHYTNATLSRVNVVAADDTKARAAAIADDARTYKNQGSKPPKVNYCEIVHVCKAVRA